jgi:YD repeat-containing protein
MKTTGSSLFSMELKYQNGTVPQFNGNISQQLYTNLTGNAFSYSYDKLNRLTSSVAGNNLGEAISYDVMGNIKSLARDGFGTNDYHIDLYDGNQLKQISGFVNKQYIYNENGNLTADGPNGINIAYNYLNLPEQVTGSQTVTYTYDASGRKLRKQSATTGTTNYVNGIHYKTDGVIDFIQTEEGIARNHSNVYNYEYNLTDHLDNVRVSFYRHPSTRLLDDLQRDDYYAFGQRKVAKMG